VPLEGRLDTFLSRPTKISSSQASTTYLWMHGNHLEQYQDATPLVTLHVSPRSNISHRNVFLEPNDNPAHTLSSV